MPSHLTAITTIFNFNEFIFCIRYEFRFFCDGEMYLLTYLLMDADMFVKRNVENLFSPLVKKVMKTVRIPFINFQSKGF